MRRLGQSRHRQRSSRCPLRANHVTSHCGR